MVLQSILDGKITAIVRNIPKDTIVDTAAALYHGGICNIEVAFNTPDAAAMISTLKEHFGMQLCVGAGTVLDAQTAHEAIRAGADFLLSPSFDTGMIETCCRYGKLAIPGVMTPTEIVNAYRSGAQMVKIFPAATLGADYFRQIKGPLDFIKVMAVGGISEENLGQFLGAGADAVGIGGNLVHLQMIRDHDFEALAATAKRFCDKLIQEEESE